MLLILAAVSIATLTGDNGILTKAGDAKEKMQRANVIEQAQVEVIGKQTENQKRNLNRKELKEILDKYFENVPEDYILETELEAKEEYGTSKIKVSEIYKGNLEEKQETIAKEISYVGYYADFNPTDGKIDGIIDADLAVGGSGRWNDNDRSDYAYEAESEGLKDYYISETEYNGILGTNAVLTASGSGKDRFYIMALEDVNTGTKYCWYNAAYGKLDKIVETSANDFGQGKENTEYVMDKWNNSTWGAQNDNVTDKDLWGEIKTKVSKGWFYHQNQNGQHLEI